MSDQKKVTMVCREAPIISEIIYGDEAQMIQDNETWHGMRSCIFISSVTTGITMLFDKSWFGVFTTGAILILAVLLIAWLISIPPRYWFREPPMPECDLACRQKRAHFNPDDHPDY